MKRYFILALCVAAVFFSACSNESKLPEATGKGTVRAINTIPTSSTFTFLIEERIVGSAEFKTATATTSWDDLEYTFNFETNLAGNPTRTRVASQFLDVEADKDYTFVISGAVAAPTISVWEGDVREWDGSETTFELRFAHVAAMLGDIDVYFAAPGIAPVLGMQADTLSFGEISSVVDFTAGDFVMTITTAGNPAMVLFESETVSPVAQTSLILSVFDGDPNDLGPLDVRLINLTSGITGSLVDANLLPTVRFFHASIDFDTADIYIDDPLGTPIVMGHAFRDVTGDIPIPAGDLPLTYTTAGNMGSILIDQDRTVIAGTRSDYYLIKNAAGDDAIVADNPDRRPVETFAKLSFINTSFNHIGVDVYLVQVVPEPPDPPPVHPDDDIPLLPGLPLGTFPITTPINADSYDIYITAPGDKAVILGPVRLDLANGDIVNAIIYDNVDPATVDLVFVPLP